VLCELVSGKMILLSHLCVAFSSPQQVASSKNNLYAQPAKGVPAQANTAHANTAHAHPDNFKFEACCSVHNETTRNVRRRRVVAAATSSAASNASYGSGHGWIVGGGKGGIEQSLPLHASEHSHFAKTIWLCFGATAMTMPVEST